MQATEGPNTPERTPCNLFTNPGFERGRDPWFSLASDPWGTPFTVSAGEAHSGSGSAYLQLRSADGGPVRVYGVVQEITPKQFPEVVSGNYYVANWQQGTPKQYLQFVVIVQDWTGNQPEDPVINNYQIRYILAGVDTQPTNITNARYVMVSHGPPPVGAWVHFERNIRQDFEQLWGAAPKGFSNIRVFFEARWDDRSDTDGPSVADVYYDDLYVGPSGGR
jgi:hypothetical protein